MTIRSGLAILVAIISSAVLIIGTQLSQPARASQSQNLKALSITLIGDSYTAGNGIGSYSGPKGSYRSSKNWGSVYASWLNTQGVKTTTTNLAWSGSKINDIVREQTPLLSSNTDLVMLTAGGNDANFEAVVKQCFATGFRDIKDCREKVEYATSQFDKIISNTETLFTSLSSKLPSSAQVVLVGYPLLSLDKTYILERCAVVDNTDGTCIKYDRYDAAKAIRTAGKSFNDKQKALVNSWNASHDLKVTFVDTIQSSFATHEPEPHATSKNPVRWINEFFETEGSAKNDGTTSSRISYDQNNWYHPNITGHRKIALDIINTVGIPSSAKAIAPTSSDTDIVFVVDTTGSMGDTINQVKANIPTLASDIASLSRTTRFALVDFQDHPVEGGGPSDYPAKVQLPFTSSIAELTSSAQNLTLGYGGDWEESVYSGAMAGLELDWRPGVKKIMIIIGDAPAKDPEPVTGYTWQQVAQKAYNVDPVEIYAIDVASGYLNGSVYELVKQTGGMTLVGQGDISAPILSSLQHSLAKPFGWIQGPYIIKDGDTLELDGSASYAVDGEITKIEWDLDGNGAFETTSPDLVYSHQFTQEFSGTIGIKITDSNGNTGYGSTHLDVTDDGDSIPASIDNCPAIANQNQADFDSDGIGDDCDDDIGWPTTDKEGLRILDYEPVDTPEAPEQPETPVDKNPCTPANKPHHKHKGHKSHKNHCSNKHPNRPHQHKNHPLQPSICTWTGNPFFHERLLPKPPSPAKKHKNTPLGQNWNNNCSGWQSPKSKR